MKRAMVIKKKPLDNIQLKKAFNRKPELAEKKKGDFLSLLNSNHIPGYYRSFFLICDSFGMTTSSLSNKPNSVKALAP
jgi:hypothetical protein